jgi:hypothetical protein
MRHGRDHEEREQKISSRTKTKPRSTTARAGVRTALSSKSSAAPTKKAVERERLRHIEERKRGRVAAGTQGKLRDERRPGVTRAQLDEAAKVADARMAKRGKSSLKPGKRGKPGSAHPR